MTNSSTITDFRNVASFLYEGHLNRYLVGPIGYKGKITDQDTFKNV